MSNWVSMHLCLKPKLNKLPAIIPYFLEYKSRGVYFSSIQTGEVFFRGRCLISLLIFIANRITWFIYFIYSFVWVRVNNYYLSMNIIIAAFIRGGCRFNWAIVHGRRLFKGGAYQGNTTCDINIQMIKWEMVIMVWFHFKNGSDCVIIYPNFCFDDYNSNGIDFKITLPSISQFTIYSRLSLYTLWDNAQKDFSLMLT